MSYPFPPTVGAYSPWGLVQSATPLGPDAVLVSAPSHGGICVSGRALSEIPQPLRSTAYSQGGWFEEDCDWAIPYLGLGLHRFEAEPGRGERLREAARRTAWTYHRAHAALLGVPADPALAEAIGRQEGR